MSRPLRFIISILLCLSIFRLPAQDIHFTLFDYSPLTLNPAYSGAFYGSIRVGGIYRDQWASFMDNPYRTPSFYLDAPLFRGFGEHDWVGAGLMFYSDQAGAGNLRTNASMLSAAYHIGLGEDGQTVLTIGGQGGNVQRRIDIQSTNLRFADELDPGVGGGGLGIGNGADRSASENVNYLDFSAGLMLRTPLGESSRLELGGSVHHLTQPEYGFFGERSGTSADNRPMRINAHGKLTAALSEKWQLTPMALFQLVEGVTNIHLQAWLGYLINPDKDIRFNFGTGYRFGDAIPVMAGMDIDRLRVGLGYDINTSSLSRATNTVGGFELAASYIINIYKKPQVDPAILCPAF